MNEHRTIKQVFKSKPTLEGAGVHLKRAFGYWEAPQLDPFLLLDDFHSANPADYMSGFTWHPHRGIETVTYMLHGEIEHGDNLGNKGVIASGDVQWMSAGSGIVHQEMPLKSKTQLWGLQLWVNLPAARKMSAPQYREIKRSQIPGIEYSDGVRMKIIAGKIGDTRGPAQDIAVDPEYLDIQISPYQKLAYCIKKGYTVFAYVLDGQVFFDYKSTEVMSPESLILYKDGEQIQITARHTPLHFLLISGLPIGEPVAWRGPIVMNTNEELQLAFQEYHDGTFIK